MDIDIDDDDDNSKDEIKVSKVVNPKKRAQPFDNLINQSPSKRPMMTKSTSERLVTQVKMRPTTSPSTSTARNVNKNKMKDEETPYVPSSRKTSVDYDNDEDLDDSNSGVNGIRRSKRKSKKRVFPDAVADLKDFSDNEGDKIPGRLIQRPIQRPRAVANDSDGSDIDNLLENDTNDDTTSDNEKQDESLDKDDYIDVEESTSKLKKEINMDTRPGVKQNFSLITF